PCPMSNQIREIVFLLLGIAIIAIALFGSKWIKNSQIEFGNKAVTFKADTIVLLILLGTIMTFVGIYFRIKNYDDELQSSQKKEALVSSRNDVLNAELDKLKQYSIRIIAVFPDTIRPDPKKLTVSTKSVKGKETPNTDAVVNYQPEGS